MVYLEIGRFDKDINGESVLLDSCGFTYHMESENNGNFHWICDYHDPNNPPCLARAVTHENRILELNGAHVHLPLKEPEEETGRLVKNIGRGSFSFIDNNGYKYFKDNVFQGNRFAWRCALKRKTQCKARVRTIGAKVYGRSGAHNHGPDSEIVL